MPGLVKKLLICAAADALFLHPVGVRDTTSVRIDYATKSIESTSEEHDKEASALEAHGIVGVLNLVSSSYLITITERKQVARIRGKSIYQVTDVTLIPLSNQKEVENVITTTHKALKQGKVGTVDEEQDEEQDEHEDVDDEAEIGTNEEQAPPAEAAALEPPLPNGLIGRSASLAKSVIQDKGKFGQFAANWMRGRKKPDVTVEGDKLTIEQEKEVEAALPKNDEEQATVGASQEKGKEEQDTDVQSKGPSAHERKSAIESLTPRILGGAKLYFSTSGFFFSYDHDLSGTLMQRDTQTSTQPLWKRFHSLYFWNRHLVSPFVEAGQDAYVLPLLQGFVGQRAFSIARPHGAEQDVVAGAAQDPAEQAVAPTALTEEKQNQEDFLLTLISRRSIKRAGLRYLRRGVDEQGNVANSVETEQILSTQDWNMSKKTFSLLQVRGSIPLFFSQSPYSFKPLPTMFGSEGTNRAAFRRHLETMSRRYGAVQLASLVDKHGTEVGIGEAFEHHAKLLNESGGVDGRPVGFEWFDFHAQCKGMKFENVSILMDILRSSLNAFGWIVKKDDRNIRPQTGVIRTNCMDCLDRSNVVQSAIAGWALQQQLAELGFNIDLQTDPKTQWFNTVWADNGDSISKQYAGTAALKGDFTRTRKRNWTGALSDFSLTLNRYYNNILGDYFLQVCIDYYLGSADAQAFDDYETNMMSQDYALDIRRVRQNAIETCMKIVLPADSAHETFISAYTLSYPHDANTVRSLPFEECVLLLTDSALYFCRFDWDAEKVGSYERIDLVGITELWRGAYVTSTLGPTHTDESKNVGFALRYKVSAQGAIVRTNTRSLGNEKMAEEEDTDNKEKNEGEQQQQQQQPKSEEKKHEDETRLLAFKALPPKASAAKHAGGEDASLSVSEQELVKHITDGLHRLMTATTRKQNEHDDSQLDRVPTLEDKDVISVRDARKSTGYMESIGYSLKKLVWS